MIVINHLFSLFTTIISLILLYVCKKWIPLLEHQCWSSSRPCSSSKYIRAWPRNEFVWLRTDGPGWNCVKLGAPFQHSSLRDDSSGYCCRSTRNLDRIGHWLDTNWLNKHAAWVSLHGWMESATSAGASFARQAPHWMFIKRETAFTRQIISSSMMLLCYHMLIPSVNTGFLQKLTVPGTGFSKKEVTVSRSATSR